MRNLTIFWGGLVLVVFFACSSVPTTKSDPMTFQLLDSLTDPRDGKRYATAQIGDRVWMLDNIHYEMPFYVVNWQPEYTQEDACHVCPPGWSLPSADDVCRLFQSLPCDSTWYLDSRDPRYTPLAPFFVAHKMKPFLSTKDERYLELWVSSQTEPLLPDSYLILDRDSSTQVRIWFIAASSSNIHNTTAVRCVQTPATAAQPIYYPTVLLDSLYRDPRDGERYRIARFGNAIWMVDNLRHEQAGTERPKSSSKELGLAYTEASAQTACPPGWRLSTYMDWSALEYVLQLQCDSIQRQTGEHILLADYLRHPSAWGVRYPYSSGFDIRPWFEQHSVFYWVAYPTRSKMTMRWRRLVSQQFAYGPHDVVYLKGYADAITSACIRCVQDAQ